MCLLPCCLIPGAGGYLINVTTGDPAKSAAEELLSENKGAIHHFGHFVLDLEGRVNFGTETTFSCYLIFL